MNNWTSKGQSNYPASIRSGALCLLVQCDGTTTETGRQDTYQPHHCVESTPIQQSDSSAGSTDDNLVWTTQSSMRFHLKQGANDPIIVSLEGLTSCSSRVFVHLGDLTPHKEKHAPLIRLHCQWTSGEAHHLICLNRQRSTAVPSRCMPECPIRCAGSITATCDLQTYLSMITISLQKQQQDGPQQAERYLTNSSVCCKE